MIPISTQDIICVGVLVLSHSAVTFLLRYILFGGFSASYHFHRTKRVERVYMFRAVGCFLGEDFSEHGPFMTAQEVLDADI